MTGPASYTYRVFWSQEDRSFVGTVAEFPGLSYLAESRQEALQGIADTVRESLAILSREGREIPRPLGERN